MTEEVTVTAESTLLQSDVALRKTDRGEGHRAAVVPGPQSDWRRRAEGRRHRWQLQHVGFESLTNGGFNINGSRNDENNITVDGATAIRTRSNGAIIGIQNVDTIQEVQVLTGDYMPEYGRVERRADPVHHQERQQQVQRQRSGITCAMTRCRRTPGRATAAPTRSRTAVRRRSNSSSTRYSVGGPIPFGKVKDKLFFFGAQEWVNFFQVSDEHRGRSDGQDADAATSASCSNPNNGFTGVRVIMDPHNRTAVPRQHHSSRPPESE